MSGNCNASDGLKRGQRPAIWLWISAGLLLVAAANAHLVYVAVTSQPPCVPHYRPGEATGGAFSAARSACRPDPGVAARAQQ